jgi:hypothetical protein
MDAEVSARKLGVGNFYAEKAFEKSEKTLLEDLLARLPPKESWDAELFLGVLVLGCVCIEIPSPHSKLTASWTLDVLNLETS